MDIFILATSRSWFLDFFRNIFAFIDSIVYSLIHVLFKTVFNLANFELVGLYEIFETRIYVILGIFMLFKVAVSLLTYLVNPDKISDKQEGASKLVTRIMMTLVMLISLPYFFNLATEFQNKLLPALPRLIIGEAKASTTDISSTSEATRVANEMSSTMIGGFAHVDDDCKYTDGTPMDSNIKEPWDLYKNINDKCPTDGSIYKYDYLPIVSTIVGVIMCYVVFSLCITVAIRAFKLIILRMLAPIPIVSYISPKSSKDGMFSTWTKTFISTWAEVFILVGLIYFVIFIIDYILSADAWVGFFNGVDERIDAILLFAFLVIGLLMFIRQAPKFVFDALGIKNKGSFTRMLGMGAAAFGVGGTVASSIRNRNEADRSNGLPVHRLRNVGASLLNGIGSASTAGTAILTSDKPGFLTGIDAQTKYNRGVSSNIDTGATFGGRLLAGAQSTLGIPTTYQRLNTKINDYKEAENAWKRIDNAMNSDDIRTGLSGDLATLGFANAAALTGGVFDSSKQYTAKEANDMVNRMKSAGGYSEAELEAAENIRKAIQMERFDYIRRQGANGATLTGTEAQIFAGTKQIYTIGKKYQDNPDAVFKEFKNATSIDDSSISMGKAFKGAAYDAGRQSQLEEASPEFKKAKEEAARFNTNNK